MSKYKVNKPNFNDNIYRFDNDDLVQGGLQGVDNKPLKELADNLAHIKKYKSQIITGTDDPNSINLYSTLKDDYQIQEDLEVEQDDQGNWYIINLLYYKFDNGTFWKCILTNSIQSGEDTPLLEDGSLLWYNLTSQTILDTNEVRIARNPGNTGTSGDYFKLVQTQSGSDEYLTVEKYTDDVLDSKLANLKVNELNVNRIDAENSNVSNIANKEVLLNSSITQESENDDSAFTVKRLGDIGLTVTSIALNVSPPSGYSDIIGFDLIVGNPTVGTMEDYLADNDFIQVHNTVDNDGFYKVATANGNNVYIYKSYFSTTSNQTNVGNIYINDSAQIYWNENDNIWELKTSQGEYLGLRVNSVSVETGTGGVDFQYGILYNRIIDNQVDFDAFFYNDISNVVINEHVLIKSNTDAGTTNYELYLNIPVTNNLVKLSMQHNVKIELTDSDAGFTFTNVSDLEWDLFFSNSGYINNTIMLVSCDKCSFNIDVSNSNGANVITANDTSSIIEVKINYSECEFNNIFNQCENFIVTNAFINNSESGNDKIFNECKNFSVDGVLNDDTFIGSGDFNW